MKNTSCHINKQRMLQPSSHHTTAFPEGSLEGTQDRNGMPAIQQYNSCSHPHGTSWGDTGWESTGYWPPESWGAHQRNDFSEPRLLAFSHTKKSTQLFNLRCLVLSNSHLLMFRLPNLCCEEPTHWRRPWCWERLRVKGDEGSRGWDG